MHESPRLDSQLLTAVLAIQSDITFIKSQQAETNRRLFGNGQPGELDKLDSRLTAIELKDAEEKGEKSSTRRWTAAIGSLCGIAAGAIGGWLAKHFG